MTELSPSDVARALTNHGFAITVKHDCLRVTGGPVITVGHGSGEWCVVPDDLGVFYLLQRLYQLQLGYPLKPTPAEVAEMARRNVLYAHAELTELLDAFQWKWHRPFEPSLPVDRVNVLEEVMDVWVFTLNVLHAIGVTDQELRNGLVDVHLKNYARLRSKVNVGTTL